MNLQQQQGDVYIERIARLPESLIVRDNSDPKKFWLAEGETHGHKHQLVFENDGDVEVFEKNSEIFLDVKNDCRLVHEEHKEQIINKGFYRVGQIHEYDYHTKQTRRVFD